MAGARYRKKPAPQERDADGWTEPGSELESKVYRILFASYQRADAAARAMARLEYELVKDLSAQQVDEPVAETELARSAANPAEPQAATAMREVGSEFDRSTFDTLFTSLNTIKLLHDLVDLLELDDVRAEVLSAVIEERFKARPSKSYEAGKPVIGTDSEVMVHNIKQMVSRAQRNRANGGTAAKA